MQYNQVQIGKEQCVSDLLLAACLVHFVPVLGDSHSHQALAQAVHPHRGG